jgi:PadR family transcriptional regulator, regulatory protein PadR
MRGARHRRRNRGRWAVRARVERFVEPAILLLLRERPMHGYELLELVPQLTRNERVDVGGLYRILRSLEDESVVTSEWSAELPGPAKRTYTLTDSGRRLLDQWAEALRETESVVAAFLERYEGERR